MNIHLRNADNNDSEFAFQTKKAAFGEYVNMVWGWDDDEQREMHEKRFSSQDFQVIQESGVDVGILAVVRMPECIKVNQLFLLPEHQNRNIGRECMLRLMEEAKRKKLPIWLRVLKVNTRAENFYHRLGFQRIGDSKNHVEMEWKP